MNGSNGAITEAVATSQRLLPLPEAARYLGCTLWSVRELIWKGQLPYTRIGRRFQVDVRDLDEFVERKKMIDGRGLASVPCVDRPTHPVVASHPNASETIDLNEEKDETGELKGKKQRGKVGV